MAATRTRWSFRFDNRVVQIAGSFEATGADRKASNAAQLTVIAALRDLGFDFEAPEVLARDPSPRLAP